MWHLALTALLAAAPASEQRQSVSSRFGMLAMESGATTRGPALELALEGRWALLGFAGPALSYRAGWRDAGGEAVGMSTTVHRLQLGLFAQKLWTRVLVGAELGLHGRLESTRLHAAGASSRPRVSSGTGVGLDLWGGVRLNDSVGFSLTAGAYERRGLVDLTLGLSLDWML